MLRKATAVAILLGLTFSASAEEDGANVMNGVPPSRDGQVTLKNYRTVPFSSWAFRNAGGVLNVLMVPRKGPTSEFQETPDPRIAKFEVDGTAFEQLLASHYTDGLMVVKGDDIKYEKYFGNFSADYQHIWFSATKSLTTTALGILVEEGKIDLDASPADYIPELKGSGFERASIQNVLDHSSAIDFKEDYVDPEAPFLKYYGPANNMAYVKGARDAQPENTEIYGVDDFLGKYIKPDPSLQPDEEFDYNSANADVAGWLLARVSGQTWDRFVHQHIWSKLGAEHDAYVASDRAGVPVATGGMNSTLRDASRFGQMIRDRGRFGEEQVVPAHWVDATLQVDKHTRDKMANNPNYKDTPWVAYRNMWWILDVEKGEYAANGIHGQFIYVNRSRDVVVTMFSHHPVASNAASEDTKAKLAAIRDLVNSEILD